MAEAGQLPICLQRSMIGIGRYPQKFTAENMIIKFREKHIFHAGALIHVSGNNKTQ